MQCQFCSFVCSSQEVLLRHHQLRHRRGFHLPCVYSDCVCSFRTRGALKSHLSRSHNRAKKRQEISTFFCDFCEFKENCSQHTFISHILRHLKKKIRLYPVLSKNVTMLPTIYQPLRHTQAESTKTQKI